MLVHRAEKHHQAHPRRDPIGNGKGDGEVQVRRMALAQNQKWRRSKTGKKETQKTSRDQQARGIILAQGPANVINRRSQQGGPGQPPPWV